MNYKTLFIIVAILAVLNIGFFYFQNTSKTKTFYPQLTNNANTISLPVNPNHKGTSSTLMYIFTGKVTKIQSVGSYDILLTLDISDPSLPKFVVKNGTIVFKNDGKNLTQTHLDSVKVGTSVAISMSYDLKGKTWTLNTVSILPNK